MPTKEDIKRWVREEHAAILAEEQAVCKHNVSGTLHDDGNLTCDQCKKGLGVDDWEFNSGGSFQDRQKNI